MLFEMIVSHIKMEKGAFKDKKRDTFGHKKEFKKEEIRIAKSRL